MKKSKITLQAAALLAAKGIMDLTVTSASAQTVEPVRVGIIDTSVDKLMLGYKDIPIERKTFVREGLTPGNWQGMIGNSHGEIVASSFVQHSREIDKRIPIAIYSANAFYEVGPRNSDGNRAMNIDYKGAERALQWFHDSGVRTVVTAFYTKDSPEMRSFIQKAKELDIVLFSGTNNDKTKVVPFPARDPYAIAVTGSNSNLDFANNPEMAKWTAFKINGDTPTPDMFPTTENGSSFAVARAAAYGAHYVRMKPAAQRDEVVKVMQAAAGNDKGKAVSDLDGGGSIKRFRTVLNAQVQSAAKAGPLIAKVDTAMATTMMRVSGHGM